ncbi:MAG: DUF3267 domain-containing protein [Anaerolineae bacterium]
MQNYDPARLRDISVPLTEIVARGLVLSLALMIVPLIPHILLHGFDFSYHPDLYLLFVVAIVVLIVAHEATHALGWMLFAGVPLRSIRFGFAVRTLSPYAHTQEPMPASGYRIGAALPLFVTGLLPVLIGTFANIGWLTGAGAMLVSGAVGDLFVLWVIRRVPADARVIDHPKNAGCYVLEE